MIEPIKIEEAEATPKIVFDKQNNNFEIAGRSLPEDASEFYYPFQKWIEEYVKDPNPTTNFHLKLEYFNSSSAKQIVDLLIKLEQIKEPQRKVKVIWYYVEDDELMKIKGEEFKSIVNLPFELKTYE